MSQSSNTSSIVKSKTGCLTCKRRRIKCDEAKPICYRCKSSGRHCSGYSHCFTQVHASDIARARDRSRSRTPLLKQPWDDTKLTELERQACDFYYNATSSSLAQKLDHNLWHISVLRYSRSDVGVRYAILAAGNLSRHGHECGPYATDTCSCRYYKTAINQYSKAISHLRKRPPVDNKDPIPGVLCALFTCLEALLGNTAQMTRLADSALSLLASENMAADHPFSEFFKRLKIYFYLLWEGYQTADSRLVELPVEPAAFASLEDARRSIYSTVADTISFINQPIWLQGHGAQPEATPPTLVAQQSHILSRIAAWHRASASLRPADRATEAFAIMTAYVVLAGAMTRTVPLRDEAAFDHELPAFTEIVGLASTHLLGKASPPAGAHQLFNFELGWMLPLYHTALKCRHGETRAQALGLLRVLPPQEGIWRRNMLFTLAERVIEREGAGELFRVVLASPQYTEDGVMKFRADYISAEMEAGMLARRSSERLVVACP